MNIKTKMEHTLEQLGYGIFRFRWLVVIAMLLVAFGFVSQLSKLQVDTSNEGFLHPEDPILVTYNAFREKYGREEVIILAIETPQIFTAKTLDKLRALHLELQQKVPYLNEVSSLINARNTRGESDRLIVEDLFERWPNNDAEIAQIKAYADRNEIYQNLLMSEDGKIAVVLVESVAYVSDEKSDALAGFDDSPNSAASQTAPRYISEAENTEMVTAVNEIVAKYQSDDFKIVSAGTPIVVEQLKNAMQHDMQTFTKNALLIIIAVLAVMFRRFSGVILPIVVVILSILSAFGGMAMVGKAMKMPTQILPSLILAVSVAASVHLLVKFFKEFDQHHDKRLAIGKTLGYCGLAIIMTSLTTAAGLLSFSTSLVAPIADLGISGGMAVMVIMLYNLILLPALLAISPILKKKNKAKAATPDTAVIAKPGLMDRLLLAIGRFSTNNASVITNLSLAIFVLSLVGAAAVKFHHDPLQWMPESWDTVKATRLVDARLKGSTTTEVIVDTGKEAGLYDPQIMAKLDSVQKKLENHHFTIEKAQVGKAYSVADVVKETNRALNENNQAKYTIPQQRELIAQELLLFEDAGSDDLKDFVDTRFSEARVSMKTPWIDAASSASFLAEIQQIMDSEFKGLAEVQITGMGPLFVRTLSAAIESMRDSYLIAFGVIFVMMVVLLGDFKLGVVSMLPNLLPISVVLSAMTLLQVPLDLFTMLVGSIAIGLAVDDTIHFLHCFKRHFAELGNVKLAVEKTLLTTGRAIMVTTIVLCGGFFVFMAATMSNVIIFGALIGSTILLALLADLILLPALMVKVYAKQESASYQSAAAATA